MWTATSRVSSPPRLPRGWRGTCLVLSCFLYLWKFKNRKFKKKKKTHGLSRWLNSVVRLTHFPANSTVQHTPSEVCRGAESALGAVGEGMPHLDCEPQPETCGPARRRSLGESVSASSAGSAPAFLLPCPASLGPRGASRGGQGTPRGLGAPCEDQRQVPGARGPSIRTSEPPPHIVTGSLNYGSLHAHYELTAARIFLKIFFTVFLWK